MTSRDIIIKDALDKLELRINKAYLECKESILSQLQLNDNTKSLSSYIIDTVDIKLSPEDVSSGLTLGRLLCDTVLKDKPVILRFRDLKTSFEFKVKTSRGETSNAEDLFKEISLIFTDLNFKDIMDDELYTNIIFLLKNRTNVDFKKTEILHTTSAEKYIFDLLVELRTCLGVSKSASTFRRFKLT